MKTYTVKVTMVTTIDVEAETENEAIEKACGDAWRYDADEINGVIIKEDEPDGTA